MNYLISITGIQSDEIHVLYLIPLHTRKSRKAQTTRRPFWCTDYFFQPIKFHFLNLIFHALHQFQINFHIFDFFTSIWFPFGNYLLLNIATDFISNFLHLISFLNFFIIFFFIEQTCLHHLPLLSHLSQF